MTATSVVYRQRRKHTAWWRVLIVSIVAIIVNIPLLDALYTSFKTDAAIGISPYSVTGGVTFSHYEAVFANSTYDFVKYLRNSVELSLGATALVLFLAVPASYAIIRMHFGGRWLLGIVTSLRLVPAMFFAIPFFLLFSDVGVYDTVVALILANALINLPVALLIICGAVRELPIEIEEAAAIDGAGPLRTLRSVVLPLLAPSLVAAGLIVFVFSWSDYLFAVTLTASRAVPVTVGAAFFETSAGVQWGNLAAITVVSVIAPVTFGFAAQKYLVRGLSSGAVK